MDPDQTVPIGAGAVLPESTLFVSTLRLVNNVRQLYAADEISRQHFKDTFYDCALMDQSFVTTAQSPWPAREIAG